MLDLNQGSNVRILTSGGEVDPNIYRIESIEDDLIGLSCTDTGIETQVNVQRIHEVMGSSPIIEEETVEPIKAEPKAAKIKTPKAPPEPIDFNQMIEDGFEVWTKTGLSLGKDPKVQEIEVAAHCVIDPENTTNRGYVVFNSYNGTRGVKGTTGKRYEFSENMTIEKKRKLLSKKGYELHNQ